MEEFPASISRKISDLPQKESAQLEVGSFESKTRMIEIVPVSSKRQAVVLADVPKTKKGLTTRIKNCQNTYDESKRKSNANQGKAFATLFFGGHISDNCSAQTDVSFAQAAKSSK